MSIYLFAQKRLSQKWETIDIKKYFWKRGSLILLFMFFLEFPGWGLSMLFSKVVSTSSGPPLPGHFEGGFLIPSTVLYGLGTCMLVGSFLWQLSKPFLLAITALSFAVSAYYINSLAPDMVLNPLEVLVLVPGMSNGAMAIYPIIPWLGIVTFGMFWANLLQSQKEKTYTFSFITGLISVGLFVGIRLLEFGNFQMNGHHDWISFFSVVKYPPSIAFFLITCGINLILLSLFYKIGHFSWLKPVKIFGQTAMFFYIVHLYIYALIGAFFPLGCPIYVMYLLWAIGLVLLYFICNWFLQFKKNKPANSWWKMV